MSSKFSTKNLIYEVNRLKQENEELKKKLEEFEKQDTCGSCDKPCENN